LGIVRHHKAHIVAMVTLYILHRGYGGWVAPNIYYLGYCGAVQFGGLTIAGLSGIYKYHDYERGHYEMPPYNEGTVRSTYHVRRFDVFKLKKVNGVCSIRVFGGVI